MTFRIFVESMRDAVQTSLSNLGYPSTSFDITQPPRRDFGDLSCNVAFQIGKQLRKKPFDVARNIIEGGLVPYFNSRKIGSLSMVESIEPHPSGYINLKINRHLLASMTLNKALSEGDSYGYMDIGKGRHIILEHTSVNPNKAIHVGHMRNIILGDSLYRLLRAANYNVTVLDYVDDSGLQVADIIVGFYYAGIPLEPKNKSIKFDHYCGDDVYVKVNELYKTNPQLEEKRRLVLKEIEKGDTEIAKFASSVSTRVLREQLKTCWRLKSHYDILNFESQVVVSKLWNNLFELLRQKGLIVKEESGKNKGCWVVKIDNEEDKVIVRSDGTATYLAKDIPYAAWKLGLVNDPFFYYQFAKQWDGTNLYATTLDKSSQKGIVDLSRIERAITIIDSRQARLQKVISMLLAQISQHDRGVYYHLGYEAVTLSASTAKALGLDIGDRQFMHMSGRKGIYVSADYVLDKLHSSAFEEVQRRNPEAEDNFLHETAEDIAISAIRYNLIKQDMDKIITFDIKESLSLEGDTGPYLQYAYARAQRMLEKSETRDHNFDSNVLSNEYELVLVKEISRLDLVLEDAVTTLSPKSIARYAYNLATAFNAFYEHVPVLRDTNLQVVSARLGLVKAFSIALKNTLNLLGISVLDKM